MSELLVFCKIKLQYLLEMLADHELDDNAFRVAFYLALAHAGYTPGERHSSFETIGAAIGKHAKSVKRALNRVEAAGYMTVERGINKGNSSRCRPTEAALHRATFRRREGDKAVSQSGAEEGQTCPVKGDWIDPRTRNENIEKKQMRASRAMSGSDAIYGARRR